MTETVAPKPEFLSLTEAAVLAALEGPDRFARDVRD
jgi:hypothetical protein